MITVKRCIVKGKDGHFTATLRVGDVRIFKAKQLDCANTARNVLGMAEKQLYETDDIDPSKIPFHCVTYINNLRMYLRQDIAKA